MLRLTKTHDYLDGEEELLRVVFVHGIAADSSSFKHAIKELTDLPGLRLVTFDLLGSGKSDSSEKFEYNYKEQIEALHNSIKKLGKTNAPLILVGHSMGTFIVTRYASKYSREVAKLILISPPVYTVKDLENPAFDAAIKAFRDAVSIKNRAVLETKAFNNSIKNIVMAKDNYETLVKTKLPIFIIYGEMDKFIASFNYPGLKKAGHGNLTFIRTPSAHGVSPDKCAELKKILAGELNETI